MIPSLEPWPGLSITITSSLPVTPTLLQYVAGGETVLSRYTTPTGQCPQVIRVSTPS